MDIGVEVARALPELRRQAERLMVERVVVRRPTGETTTDPTTFDVVRVFEVVYLGRAKSQTYEAYEQASDVAGATAVVSRLRYDFPVGSFKSQPGDITTCLENPLDPLLVGRTVRLVNEAPVKTWATAYRVFADLNVGEEVPPWQPEQT